MTLIKNLEEEWGGGCGECEGWGWEGWGGWVGGWHDGIFNDNKYELKTC